MRIATPDLVTNSYFPALAAEELGVFREEGLDAHVQLLPSLDAVNALRDGGVDFVAGGAHTTLLAFPQWKGVKLVVTLSQGTPWLLVVRADLPARRGDIGAVKGLRIGAAPGPDRAFLHLLAEVGIDPARDGVTIGPVPGGNAPGASFGVVAADALERRLVDGFWANALGSETAVRRGVGKIIADVRRGDGPPGAGHYTFAALATSDALIARDPERGRPSRLQTPQRGARGREGPAGAGLPALARVGRARVDRARVRASLRLLPQSRIEQVAQPVAEEIDPEHGDENRDAREDRDP